VEELEWPVCCVAAADPECTVVPLGNEERCRMKDRGKEESGKAK
jgi:hypothetical protein